MRVEISIAKEKAGKMPKGSLEALKDEMTRRVSKQYDDVEVIVKTASNDGLSVLWATDKEIAKEFVETTLKDAWETADDWFVRCSVYIIIRGDLLPESLPPPGSSIH